MDAVTYVHARQSLAKLMDETQANHEPIVINRQQKGSVVMMSLEDYNGLMATLHLLRSPRKCRAAVAFDPPGRAWRGLDP